MEKLFYLQRLNRDYVVDGNYLYTVNNGESNKYFEWGLNWTPTMFKNTESDKAVEIFNKCIEGRHSNYRWIEFKIENAQNHFPGCISKWLNSDEFYLRNLDSKKRGYKELIIEKRFGDNNKNIFYKSMTIERIIE